MLVETVKVMLNGVYLQQDPDFLLGRAAQLLIVPHSQVEEALTPA